MARDVNALINKCENAITQEEKTISDAKEKIRKLRKELLLIILFSLFHRTIILHRKLFTVLV